MSYIEVTGKNEEEAIAKALEQLGMERFEVSVEILERAKSGFLGLGGRPARVRVGYGLDEEEETKSAVSVKAKPVEKKKTSAMPPQKPLPQKTAQKREEKPEQKRTAAVPTDLPVSTDENIERITTFLEGLLRHMDLQANIQVREEEKGHYQVVLKGDKLGMLIGRRGETLDAVQQITNYAVNGHGEKRIRVQIDAENYRAKREANLAALAHKVAAKVVANRRSMTLESMNAYERHVIHVALQDEAHITTYSVGNEPNRRIVIAYKP